MPARVYAVGVANAIEPAEQSEVTDVDFGALPPEINSGRMYIGPGAAPMLAAAAAWDGLAAELHATAAAYSSVISELTAEWQGPSSASMVAAAAPYVTWMSVAATQAEKTAAQAKVAAGAYETAFAATVPPPVIAANRSTLMSLIATNIFGQNTSAIAATEAHYAEMWAQDAAAMYGYAGSSASATEVTPFSPPPQTTNPAGVAGQAGAVTQAAGMAAGTHAQTLPQLMSAVPQSLHSLATPGLTTAADPPSPLMTIDSFITGPLSPTSLFPIGGVPALLGMQSYLLPQAAANLTTAAEKVSQIPTAAGGNLLAGELGSGTRMLGATGWSGAESAVSAGVGRAGLVGSLSVPQGWATAAPAIKPVAAVLPEIGLGGAPPALAAAGQGGLFSNMALSSLAGRALVGTGDTAARSTGVGAGVVASGESATTSNIFVISADD